MPHLRFRITDELALIDLKPGRPVEMVVEDVAVEDDGATVTVRLTQPQEPAARECGVPHAGPCTGDLGRL